MLIYAGPTIALCVLNFAPYILTFGPGACGDSLLSTGANILLGTGGHGNCHGGAFSFGH